MSISSKNPNVQVVSESLDDGSLSIHLTISKLEPTINNLQARQLEGTSPMATDEESSTRLRLSFKGK